MLGPFYVNNQTRRIAAWGQPCKIDFTRVKIGQYNVAVNSKVAVAFEHLEDVRAKHNYNPTGTDTGAYNCRYMRHNPSLPWSSHAWATALDWNWLQNPAGSKLVTDMPREMIRELQSLRTQSGAWVFMWGGDWDRDPRTNHSYYDAMHWEVIAHPLDLATGIEGVENPGGPNVGLNEGERSGGVRALQTHLNDWKPAFQLEVDGIYGSGTASAVRDYQTAAGFEPTGQADNTTLVHLYTNAFRNPNTLKRIVERAE